MSSSTTTPDSTTTFEGAVPVVSYEHDLTIPLAGDDVLTHEEEMRQALQLSRNDTYTSTATHSAATKTDGVHFPVTGTFFRNRGGLIQGEAYERIRVGSRSTSVEQQQQQQQEEHTNNNHVERRAWSWFTRMRPVREAVQQGKSSGSRNVGHWKYGRSWEKRILYVDLQHGTITVHYPSRTKEKEDNGPPLTARTGRPSALLNFIDNNFTCGDIYIRPKQKYGLVKDEQGALHPVHQLKIYRNTECKSKRKKTSSGDGSSKQGHQQEVLKIGMICRDDLVFLRTQILRLSLERQKKKQSQNKKKNSFSLSSGESKGGSSSSWSTGRTRRNKLQHTHAAASSRRNRSESLTDSIPTALPAFLNTVPPPPPPPPSAIEATVISNMTNQGQNQQQFPY